MVTDQPFWRRQTGAHQRIWSLTQFLRSQDISLVIFYMVERTGSDREACESLMGGKNAVRFVDFDSGKTRFPDLLSPVMKLAKLIGGAGDPLSDSEETAENLATLSDFRWPHAQTQFLDLIKSERPHVVLVQYVTWSNLLDNVDRKKLGFRSVVDTHDALHVRCQQFRENGKTHWIEITRAEEAAALQNFDLIISIQEKEAELFREMAPDSAVMVVGHVPNAVNDETNDSGPSDDIVRLGFIGSVNHANLDGITWFLRDCWAAIREQSDRCLELVVGGPIEEKLRNETELPLDGIKFSGQVDDIADFYRPLDLVINPVRFGSGLKIKSVESICFGKPLVSHPHSVAGMSQAARGAVEVAERPEDFVACCVRLIQDKQHRESAAARARQVAESEFSAKSVYSHLCEWMKQHD